MATVTLGADGTGSLTTTTFWTAGAQRQVVIFNESEKPVKMTLSGNGDTAFDGFTLNDSHEDERILVRNEINVEGASSVSLLIVPTAGGGTTPDTATFSFEPLHTASGMSGDTILIALRSVIAAGASF